MTYRYHKFFAAFCTFFLFLTNAFAGSAVVNVPVADMHKQPNADAPVISQSIYGSDVQVINQTKSGWSLIGTHDYYTGWVKNSDLVYKTMPAYKHVAEAANLFTAIYREADMNKHKPLIVPFSAKLPLIKIVDEKWLQVQLPNGGSGYIRRGDATIDPKPLTMKQMLKESRKFVGLSYIWGGASTYGFDCSGFVQMLYKQIGITLPRDTGLMADWNGFISVSRQDLRPGDVLFFGYDNKISHTGVYLGNNLFVNSTSYSHSLVQISDLRKPHWNEIYITARRLKQNKFVPVFKGTIDPLPGKVASQMRKYTWHKGCPVPLKDLAYLTLSYWGFDNKPHQGALIIHKNVAPEVLAIFKDLYQQRFPINKMRPMYLYKGNDNAAMLADNTSAFNCRMQTDFPDLFSAHSYGGAIDINPLINPYVNNGKVEPPQSKKYLDRNVPYKGKVTPDGIVVKDFAKHGWAWGGSWPGKIKDYQHFEKQQKGS